MNQFIYLQMCTLVYNSKLSQNLWTYQTLSLLSENSVFPVNIGTYSNISFKQYYIPPFIFKIESSGMYKSFSQQ